MSSPMVPRISSDMKFANKPMISPKNHNADDDCRYFFISCNIKTKILTKRYLCMEVFCLF